MAVWRNGRRACFKNMSRKGCGFDSLHRYQLLIMTTTRHTAPLAVLNVLLNPNQDRALIMRRGPEESLAGMYTIPGGHMEIGENVLDAAVRELREETGVHADLKDCEVIGVIHGTAGTREYVQFVVLVHRWIGTPSITEPDNCDDMYWCEITNLPKNTLGWPVQAITMAIDSIHTHDSWEFFLTNINNEQHNTETKTTTTPTDKRP